jgi:hypothetical protein
MEKEVKTKKCSNCCRVPQPIEEFVNAKGRECSTCNKCREKGKKHDNKPERREYHNELNKEKGYAEKWRSKQLEERPEEFRAHRNETHKKWRSENSEHAARWYRTNVNPRLDALKRAAISRNIVWSLTDDEAKAMLVKPCIYCGVLDLTVRVNGIDRLDSAKPYTVENCRSCCKDCNYMKGTYDPRTFIERAKKIALCEAVFPEVPVCGEHKKIHRPTTSHVPESAENSCSMTVEQYLGSNSSEQQNTSI